LMRVAMLAPIILLASILVRRLATIERPIERPPLLPGFVIAFIALMALNSFGAVPLLVTKLATDIAGWALLTAIAAVGLKTSLKEVIKVGTPAIALLVVETLFLACIVVAGLFWLKVS
ncbi:MAG: putative sulfate exporter family transporter, partial [Pseudomonadota bacterium]